MPDAVIGVEFVGTALPHDLAALEMPPPPEIAAIDWMMSLEPEWYSTVFGAVEVMRMGYSRPGQPSIFPLDQALSLPQRSFSYELQRRLVKAAVQNPFLASVETIAELIGVSVSKRSLEQVLPDVAQDFDVFYQQRPPDTATGSILVAAVDGKGQHGGRFGAARDVEEAPVRADRQRP